MRKKFILGVLSCMILFACEQKEEYTEIETIETKTTRSSGENTSSAIPDLTFVDGTPVEYTIEDVEIIVIYEPGTTEAEKAQVRSDNGTIYGQVQVTPCSLNSDGEIWNSRRLVIHNWEDAPYQELNQRQTDPIEDPDIVKKAVLRKISYKTYRINDPSIVCD